MAPTTVEDDLKLLYTVVKVCGVKPRNAEVGKLMGLTPGATAWRFNSLMKRLEKQFGAVGEGDASEAQSSSPPKANKRKKAKGGDAEVGPEGSVKDDDDDDAGQVSKKPKLTTEKAKPTAAKAKPTAEEPKDNKA